MSHIVSTRQIMLPITPSISVLRSSPKTSATFWNSYLSYSLATVVSCLIMSSILKQLSLFGVYVFVHGPSTSQLMFLLLKKPVSFSSTVTNLADDSSSEFSFCKFVPFLEGDINSSSSLSECSSGIWVGFVYFWAEYGGFDSIKVFTTINPLFVTLKNLHQKIMNFYTR